MNQVKYGILHWGPCIVKTKVDPNTLDLLLSEGKSSREDASPELAGVLKNQFHYRDKAKFQKFMEGTFSLYNAAMQQWKQSNEKTPSTYFLEKLWINYQGPNEFNPPHDHSDDISFTAYLQVPKEIKEEFDNFKGKSSGPGGISFLYGEGNRQAITYQSHFPEEGDLFMFPSWLKHYVAPYHADVTRISIAGNLSFQTHLKDIRTDLFKQPPEDDKKA